MPYADSHACFCVQIKIVHITQAIEGWVRQLAERYVNFIIYEDV